MKRRNLFKLAGCGGAGVATALQGNRSIAAVATDELSNLPSFDFATIKVNRAGKEEQRTYHQARLYLENLGNFQTLSLVAIPAGKFIMGASAQEKDSSDRERPLHRVKINQFLLGAYPITQVQWRQVAKFPQVKRELKLDPAHFQGDYRPVESVSWLEAIEFCDRLSAYTGKLYRLPSEAEWEYACRGNAQTAFAYGETLTNELADYSSTYAYASEIGSAYRKETTNVGSFMPNAFGLYDVHGNVREWCADPWHENYHGAPSNSKTWSKGGKQAWRTLRGGSWANQPSHCRSAHRSGYPAASFNRAIGFRVAMSL
ncbi:MAG: formylglycine-generating enzyme family protein [Cyanobacteria bacterium J06638_38]